MTKPLKWNSLSGRPYPLSSSTRYRPVLNLTIRAKNGSITNSIVINTKQMLGPITSMARLQDPILVIEPWPRPNNETPVSYMLNPLLKWFSTRVSKNPRVPWKAQELELGIYFQVNCSKGYLSNCFTTIREGFRISKDCWGTLLMVTKHFINNFPKQTIKSMNYKNYNSTLLL